MYSILMLSHVVLGDRMKHPRSLHYELMALPIIN
jgi:hypothetical protein